MHPPRRDLRRGVLEGHTDLDPVRTVGVFGEVGAARMTRRNILDAIRAAHRVEGAGWTGAVGVAQRQRAVEGQRGDRDPDK